MTMLLDAVDPFADPAAIAYQDQQEQQRREQNGQPQTSQPIPGIVHGSIPGIVGIDPGGAGLWNSPFASAFAGGAGGAESAGVDQSDNVPLPQARPLDLATRGDRGDVRTERPGDEARGSDAPNAALATTPRENSAQVSSGVPQQDRGPFPQGSLLDLVTKFNDWRNQNRLTLLAMAGGLAGSQSIGQGLGRAFTAAVPAQRMDILQNQQNQTAQAFANRGIPPDLARAAALNPATTQALLGQMMGVSPPAHVMVKNMLGGETPYLWDPNKHTFVPAMGNGAASGGGGLGAGGYPNNLSPEQWNGMTPDQRLATLDPVVAGEVRAVHEGVAAVPGRQPYVMGIAKMVYPGFDENDFNAAKNAAGKLTNLSNNQPGGILNNVFSSFDHLSELSDSMVRVGAYNGGGLTRIGQAGNILRNISPSNELTNAQSDEASKALKYGQESTKAYAGSGGGEGERTHALNEATGVTTTSAAKAGFLRAEYQLMQDRMNNTLATVGGNPAADKWIEKHKPQLQKMQEDIARIKTNIAKLDPSSPEAKELSAQQTQQAQTAPAAARPMVPAAQATTAAVSTVPAPDQRRIGQVYQTPRGPARWLGNGWQLEPGNAAAQ
jgi:hypothetical protein